MQSRLLKLPLCLLLSLLLLAAPAAATWSIVVVNTRTGEVCVASATCLSGFNLRRATPVLIPGVGGAAAQSYLDNIGNRLVIHDSMLEGKSPDEILELIRDRDNFLRGRQYGMVDLQGRALTFTGSSAGGWAGGLTGTQGDYVYAIQGNVLAGQLVVDECERAFLQTQGDMSAKVMASMEAANAAGGDGRCSCDSNNPESCGAPPPNFTHGAYCAYLLVARPGDPKKDCDMDKGCGRGAFYLAVNIKNLGPNDPEPIGLMRQEYDAWRVSKQGKPDAVQSVVLAQEDRVVPGRLQPVVYELELYDLDGVAVTQGGATVTLEHQLGSAGLATLGQVTDLGNGSYTVEVIPGTRPGLDRFAFRVDDGSYGALLWPPQNLLHEPPPVAPANAAHSVSGLPGTTQVLDAYVHRDDLRVWCLADDAGGTRRLFRSERTTPQDPFGAPVVVEIDGMPTHPLRSVWVSDDESQLIFSAEDPADGVERLYRAERAARGLPFENVRLCAALNSDLGEGDPWVSDDELELIFRSERSGVPDLMQARRRTPSADWFAPQPIPGLARRAQSPMLIEDGLRLIYSVPAHKSHLHYAEREPAGGYVDRGPYPGQASRSRTSAIGWIPGPEPAIWQRFTPRRGPYLRATLAVDSFVGGPDTISAAAGGTASWHLDAGPRHGGGAYEVLVGLPGGVSYWDLVVLPFIKHGITERVRARAELHGSRLPGLTGTLDQHGRADLRATALPGELFHPRLMGHTLVICFAVSSSNGRFVSNPLTLTILP